MLNFTSRKKAADGSNPSSQFDEQPSPKQVGISNPPEISLQDIELINSTQAYFGFKLRLYQTLALYQKSLLLMFRRRKILFLRAFLIPILFTLYMGFSKYIYYPIEHYGIANANQSVRSLSEAVGDSLVIPYYAMNPDRVSTESMHSIMNTALSGVSQSQIRYITSTDDLFVICAQSLRGVSKCYGGVQWNDLDPETGLYNYTIRGNWGLGNVNVLGDNSDTDHYVLPLQLAVDNSIRNSTVSIKSVPYTSISDEENKMKRDQSFMDSIRDWISPSLYVSLIGVVYQLSGTVAQDRELGLTSLLYSMQTTRRARLAGYHTSFSTVYLPSWIIVGVIFAKGFFKHTNAAIPIFMTILQGLASVSWAILLGTLFPSAQLAGITAAAVSIILAILTSVQVQAGGGAEQPAAIYVCSFLFNPMSFCMLIQLLCQNERDYTPTSLVKYVNGGSTYPIVPFLTPVFQIFFYLGLTVVLEYLIYGKKTSPPTSGDESTAIQINGLNKEYNSFWSLFKGKNNKNTVHAVSDLSLTITSHQIFSLLGANGSGKTTTLEMIAGIQTPSSGSIVFGPRTKLGICPQKNVLWPNLTVREHIKMWSRVKGVASNNLTQVTDFFIQKCGLTGKADTLSKNLSGGQKRKLQLAIMFTGGSNLCCIDEVSSGLDPVSRRVIWDILLAFRATHTLILTTHFLDEADLLSDNIAVLSKGVLQADGSPISLKQELGSGYRVYIDTLGSGQEQVCFLSSPKEVLEYIKPLEVDNTPFRILGPELEDVFLKLASKDHEGYSLEYEDPEKHNMNSAEKNAIDTLETDVEDASDLSSHQVGMFRQLLALLQKRYIIFRRAPFAEIVFFALPIVVAGACSGFLSSSGSTINCSISNRFSKQKYTPAEFVNSITLPVANEELFRAGLTGYNAFVNGIASWNGNGTSALIAQLYNQTVLSGIEFVPSFDQLYEYLKANYSSTAPGGISLVPDNYAIGYQADSNGGVYYSTMLLNLFTNLVSNGSPQIITNFSPFQISWVDSTGKTLQYIVYVGLGIAVAPAFAGLYPTFERLSNVRAMQYSNGVRVVPLWVSHLLFNFFLFIIVSAIVVGIMNSGISGMYGPGYMFVSLFLYFTASVLLSFVVSLFVQSQLAAFAVVAAYQAVMVLVFLVGYLSTQTFGDPMTMDKNTRIIYFTIATIAPSQSLMRAMFVTFNMFGILCGFGTQVSYMGDILAFGGPILYLVLQSVVLFGFLVWWDSGNFHSAAHKTKSVFKRRKQRNAQDGDVEDENTIIPEVLEEEEKIVNNHGAYSNGLIVSDVSKVYGKKTVVNHSTFGVTPGDCFALLGPNGAGKTTTFNMIRGEVPPTSGEIFITGISISEDRALARTQLGVCPQFDAMDKLTVTEVLLLYSKLRGVRGGPSKIKSHVDALIVAVDLVRFKSRMAHKLSGGNKRKLSLAVALVGNPSVLLLDEPSSGMDAFAKRIMWRALAAAKKDRAMVLTTHSMEEADALANRAGILAKKMLAIGTTEDLRHRHCGEVFHVHLVCQSSPETSIEEMRNVVENVKELFGPQVMVEDRMYQGQIKIVVPVSGKNGNVEPTDAGSLITNPTLVTTNNSPKDQVVVHTTSGRDYGGSDEFYKKPTSFGISQINQDPEPTFASRTHSSQQSVSHVSQIFQLLEEHKQMLGIRSYSVFPTRLEEVFLKIVGEYVEKEEH